MPIKLPKHFPRRRSSGNALEDQNTPTEPSFRVLERPSNQSFEGPDHLRRLSQGRPLDADHLKGQPVTANVNNRGSGATNNSTSSGGPDNSSLSAGHSSTSTLPSSAEGTSDERPRPKHSFTMPVPTVPESTSMASLKAAGRAFSFGRKKAESQALTPRPLFEHAASDGRANYTRERAHTETSYTSESTATPPKLLEAGLDFGSSDNFGAIFDGFGKRASQLGTESAQPYAGTSHNVTSTPESFALDTSQGTGNPWLGHIPPDANTRPIAPTMERTFSYEGVTERIDHPSRIQKSTTTPLSREVMPNGPDRPSRRISSGFPKASGYGERKPTRQSSGFQDDDASLVMNSLAVGRRLDLASKGGFQDSDEEDNPEVSLVGRSRQTPSPNVTAGAQQYSKSSRLSAGQTLDNMHSDLPSSSWQTNSASTTPRARLSDSWQQERSLFDASPPLRDGVTQASLSQAPGPRKPQTQNKIMTPSQFEKYRREQEMNQAMGTPNDRSDSDEEVDGYEDDDEMEHSKQLEKQRRKQEAHLAVYRQQMMKVTGEQPLENSNLQFRSSADKPNGQTSATQRPNSSLDINFDKPADGDKASDDEDEDVPLGVLAAHGFPSKSRPPTAMSGRESRVQYKSESYPPPASNSGTSQAGRASGLPPFAKNLPQDPYYGASLVNPANRESLAYAHQGPGAPAPASNPPHVPPAGLVGVIAGEERARAARRGSPNAQAMPQQLGQMPGMPPGMPPMMSPGERATVQMSEQMAQMMQMQVQWMQQMQHMMASGMQLQSPPSNPMMLGQPGMAIPPMMGPTPMMPPMPHNGARPTSSGAAYGPPNPGQSPSGGRAMSMMNTSSMPSWPAAPASNRQSRAPSFFGESGLRASGYTPSIAPSERSNVGMPSRYRPVSIAPVDEYKPKAHSRSSTMNSNTLQPGGFDQLGRHSTSHERKSNLSSRPLTPNEPRRMGSDDDDEEGWEEMKKKRDKKKGLWRINRKKEEPVEQGLEYYDYPGD